jgi:hypothetical protein
MSTKQHPCFPAAGRPIELLGIKGPYILLLAAVLLGDFLLFVITYCMGLPPVAGIAMAFAIGAGGWMTATLLSKRFGPHGLSKQLAARHRPKGLRLDSRQAFLNLQKQSS